MWTEKLCPLPKKWLCFVPKGFFNFLLFALKAENEEISQNLKFLSLKVKLDIMGQKAWSFGLVSKERDVVYNS